MRKIRFGSQNTLAGPWCIDINKVWQPKYFSWSLMYRYKSWKQFYIKDFILAHWNLGKILEKIKPEFQSFLNEKMPKILTP